MSGQEKKYRVKAGVKLSEYEKWAIDTFWAPIIEAGSLPDNGDGYPEEGDG